jgi:hypothetical protein
MDNRALEAVLSERGYGIIPPPQFRTDMEKEFILIWKKIESFTMTSVERGYSLFKAVKYTVEHEIEGVFTECGVWKGGSAMLIAETLKLCGITDREIWLYDTFEGMTKPGRKDFVSWNNKSVLEMWEEKKAGQGSGFKWWAEGVEAVTAAMEKTFYPAGKIKMIKGDVVQTLKTDTPDKIALLRLDTDWYESTLAELSVLYPLLSEKGVLIIDDYGHFSGAKAAVDEYFADKKKAPFFSRIDYTGRLAVKYS